MESIKVREPKTCPSRILKSYVANISFRCLKIKGLSLNMLYCKYLFDIDFPVSLFAAAVVVVGVKYTQFSLGVCYYIYIFVLPLLLDEVQRRI